MSPRTIALTGLALVAFAANSILCRPSPVLVAFGGVLFLGEDLSLRLGVATVAIVGGIVLAIWAGRGKAAQAAGAGPSRASR